MSNLFTRNVKERKIPWYLRQDGTCDCIPPWTCCPLCCSNWNTAECEMDCNNKYDKWLNPIAPMFKAIDINRKTVRVIKLNIFEKAIVYLRDILPREE